jgi:hypothetical protein
VLLLFEVSDKFHSWTERVTLDVALCVVCFALARFRRWLAIVGIAIGALFAWAEIDFWVNDPMSAALIREQGQHYFALPLAAHFLVVAAATCGATCAWRAQRTNRSMAPTA